MRRALGATLWLAGSACRPTGGTPSGFTLLFFDHSPAAALAGRSWVPLPDSSRLVAFDPQLRIVRTLTDPRLNTPVAVVPYRGRDLLVTEFTGAGLVVDTAGRALREWPGPFTASLYTAGGGHVLASRSPYFVQPLAPESPPGPLVQLLDSAGRPTDGLGQPHVPDSPFLLGPTNAGALAADSGGAFYFGPLARDEISKYDRTGRRLWTTRRGLRAHETDPVFLPARGGRLPLALAAAHAALPVGPDCPPYPLGSQDSPATPLRPVVLDAAPSRSLQTPA